MTKDVSINQTVLDFLDYYTDAERQLDYAVLLDGPWGAGKTHLARAFLDARKARGGKCLYVSLYGVTSTTQIEDEFYRLLHPVLSSKGMRIAGTLLRSAAKGLLRFDLTGMTISENVTFGVPEINLADHLKHPAEQLLVFDDLDRCMMPPSEVLGYINAFVEHEGMKVILIANEAEITKRDNSFPTIREKLIGQTLRVRSDFGAAYPDFLNKIAFGRAHQILAAHRNHVLAIYSQSGTDNLRLLKQSMWDFERLSAHIPEGYWQNCEAIVKLLQLTLAMSMEVRAGRIRSDDLPKLVNTHLSRYLRQQQDKTPGPDDEFERRYTDVSLADAVFRPDVLGRIIVEGLNDVALVEKTLRESGYFAKPSDVPAWVRAWRGFESDDADYEAALKEVVRQFDSREELNCAILYHIFGILLFAADTGALLKTRAEVLAGGRAYVDDLVRNGRIVSSLTQSPEIDGSRSFAGFGYTEIQSPEFTEFVRCYSDAANAKAIKSHEEIARTVLARIKKEPDEFIFDLCVNNVRASLYYETPILAALPASEFVTMLLSLPARRQMTVFSMFKGRYQHAEMLRKLASEKPWLSEVRRLLVEATKTAKPMTRYRINAMVERDIGPLLAAEWPDDQSKASAAKAGPNNDGADEA